MVDELKFGEFNPDGSIKRDVRTSALSGRRTEPGDPLIGIPNTPYFYRLEAQEFRLLHDDSDPEAQKARQRQVDDLLSANFPRSAPVVAKQVAGTKEDKGVNNG